MKIVPLQFTHEDIIVTIPTYVFEGAQAGPHMVISGGIHGNEINGIMMCEHIRQYCLDTHIEKKLSGTLTIVPVINILGFEHMMRYVPIDNRDLNRSFGVSTEHDTFSSHYADYLVNNLYAHADHVIDIHDAGGRSALIPHARIHSCEKDVCHTAIHQMAKWFDSKIIMERGGDQHMLAVYLNAHYTIPVMTIELGGGQMIFNHFYDDCLQGILNILKGHHYIRGDLVLLQDKQYFLSERQEYKAKKGGVVHHFVALGEYVQVGQKISHIYYPETSTGEDIVAIDDGFVFSLRQADQIYSNMSIFSLLLQ